MQTQAIYTCTASLIASDILITAAHCLTVGPRGLAAPEDRLYAVFATSVDVFDSTGRARETYEIPLHAVRIHPKFDPSDRRLAETDLAVARLPRNAPAPFSPVKLLGTETSVTNPGTAVTSAGFGLRTRDGSNEARGRYALHALDSQTVPHGGRGSHHQITVRCSAQRTTTSGDSGGPLFVRRHGELFLWGVDSKGDAQTFVQYESIVRERAWLDLSIRELRASAP